MNRLLFQILALHILPDQTATGRIIFCFFQCIFVSAGIPQLFCRCLNLGSIDTQCHGARLQLRQILGKSFLRLFFCQSTKGKIPYINTIRICCFFCVSRECHCTPQGCHQRQSPKQIPYFHKLLPLLLTYYSLNSRIPHFVLYYLLTQESITS